MSDLLWMSSAVASSSDWRNSAACSALPITNFFTDGRRVSRMVREMCASCPVRQDCLEYVMTNEEGSDRKNRFGFYGGLTSEERFKLAQERAGKTYKPKSRTRPWGDRERDRQRERRAQLRVASRSTRVGLL